MIPVFDETKNKIFLPNGDIITKGKFHIIAFFAPEIIILNNDSGINLLTGQIAPKNEKEFHNIKAIKYAIERCKEIEKIYSIFGENNFLESDKDWKPKDFNKVLEKLKALESELNREPKQSKTLFK